ncbi:MAG: hypothetical protein K2G45_00670 [Lachnospiraceae bacterium]|nr:hypothetical protein [Lachnospiraceae bacterium]
MSKLKENYKDSFSQKFSDFMTGDLEVPDSIHARKKQDRVDKIVEADQFFSEFTTSDDIQRRELYQAFKHRRFVKHANKIYSIMSAVIGLIIIIILLITVAYLPEFGNKSNPDNNVVSQRYIENGLEETGAVNIVSGMILDYRAFDTFGESNVLFIACCCVLILLRNDDDEINPDEDVIDFKRDIILEKAAKFLVPVILVFGIYVVLNGHLSPGGGFSGGAIMGAGLILFANAYGFERMERLFSYSTFKKITFGALLFYGVAKSYSFFTGANHLHSIIPLGTPGAILSSGLILYLNICVGLVVACTMYGFFALFKRGRI